MCGIGEALNNLFPTGWLDPYGSMPLNKEYSVQIDITQVETDDGIKVTAVKTPPRASTTSVQDAINMALGLGCKDYGDDVEYKDNIDKSNKRNDLNKENNEEKEDSDGKRPDVRSRDFQQRNKKQQSHENTA